MMSYFQGMKQSFDARHIVNMFCNVCQSTINLQRCARCKQVFYCGRKHQTKDWKHHKTICKTNESNLKDPDPENDDIAVQSKIATSAGSKIKDVQENQMDDRPTRLHQSKAPPSDVEIGHFIADQLKSSEYCVLDGYLPIDLCERMLDEIIALDKSGKMRNGKLAGGRTSGVKSEMVVNLSIRSDTMTWIEGNDSSCPTISKYATETLDSLVIGLNKYFDEECLFEGHTKAMAACYPGGGTGYAKHIDNPTKDGRRLTCILYLNPEWNAQENGGLLRIFDTDKKEGYVDIDPIMNRLLFFWSDKSPHEVRPAFHTRYAVTVWYFDKLERHEAKLQQASHETDEIRQKITEVEIQTKQMQKELVEQKLENETNKAVQLLSAEEIQAIGALVGDRPDARQVLESMGISPVIVDSLLKQLKSTQK